MKKILVIICSTFIVLSIHAQVTNGVRVGAGVAELLADRTMQIAGGILPGTSRGQDGKLRVVAVVMEKQSVKIAIASCDIIAITRLQLEPALSQIEKTTGIPQSNVLIQSTHTHHSPSIVRVHGYEPDPVFPKRVQDGIVEAVQKANSNLSKEECSFSFWLGKEETVGQNSRWILPNGQINWTHPMTEYVRPTGPFDPELPVLTFSDQAGKMRAMIFNHSTHHIGTRNPGFFSPGFYGLAAQRMEQELDCPVCFIIGAFGSTHNVTLTGVECMKRIERAVLDANDRTQVRPVEHIAVIRRPFKFKVRQFDEAKEDEAVKSYSRSGEDVIRVFRAMRKNLAPQQGQERETWLQVMLIGDIAIAGVPGELFTQLGVDIKTRSPFRYTYVAGLANDWIGYLPDLTSFKLGGYQVWTGYHSYVEPGTGERMVDEIVAMLKELAQGASR